MSDSSKPVKDNQSSQAPEERTTYPTSDQVSQPPIDQRRTALGIIALVVIGVVVIGSGMANSVLPSLNLDGFFQGFSNNGGPTFSDQRVVREESLVVDVVEQASPSVVSIAATQQRFNLFNPQPTEEEQGIGTGFIISENGLILTNKHVVSSDEIEYSVITNDGTSYEIKEIYRDPSNDLALVIIDADNLKPLELGDSDSLQVGQFVIAIGNALGEFSNTVTTGVVSGLGRGVTAGDSAGDFITQLDNVIQTDAAINRGNSGGPLLNSAGQVIGINTAVSQNAQNIGFAIPINTAKPVIDEFNQTGRIIGPPFLGVGYQIVTERTAILNEVPQGMYVSQVVRESPADQAGLEEGDIITKINDTPMTEEQDLGEFIRERSIGDSIEVEYWRDGETRTTTAKLIEAPAE